MFFSVQPYHNVLVLILAGGRGQRLQELTKWRVKPAIPFGGKFRIIDFVLSNAVNSQLRRIDILTQYKSQSLIRHIMRGWNMHRQELGEFIECLPAQKQINDNWYLGTADAVFQNMDLVQASNSDTILILGGDHIYTMDYKPMIDFHRQNDADLTIGALEVNRDQTSSFGVLDLGTDDRVVGFIEKPDPSTSSNNGEKKSYISMGIYAFKWDFLKRKLLSDSKKLDSKHDFGRDIIPASLHDRVFAYKHQDPNSHSPLYWRDVGTLDSYWQSNMELIGPLPRLNLYNTSWPVHTSPHHYPPAKFVPGPEGKQGHAIDSIIAEGSIISGATVQHSLLSQNVWVDEGAFINESVILPDVHIGKKAHINRAVIDSGTCIPDHLVVGKDSKADAKQFTITSEGIVLVTAEMLGQDIYRDL